MRASFEEDSRDESFEMAKQKATSTMLTNSFGSLGSLVLH